MRNLIGLAIVGMAIVLVGLADPAVAQSTVGIGSPVGVPGPILGAGLPAYVVGYGVYWLIKRYRRQS